MSELLLRMSTLGKSSSQRASRPPHQKETESCCSLWPLQMSQTKLICGRRAMKKIPLTRCALFLCLLAAFLLSGCQGVGLGGGPTPTPTPTATPATLQSVNHIIFMMQENRSFDAYFGKLNDYRASFPGGALGRDADDLETDFTNP